MTSEIGITVRYFAAARAAVGSEVRAADYAVGHHGRRDPVTGLADRQRGAGPGAVAMPISVAVCTRVRDRGQALKGGTTVDVLPPFAGG